MNNKQSLVAGLGKVYKTQSFYSALPKEYKKELLNPFIKYDLIFEVLKV